MEEDNDDGLGLDAQIVRTLTAGTYTVEASTHFKERTGDFSLSISTSASDNQVTRAVTENNAGADVGVAIAIMLSGTVSYTLLGNDVLLPSNSPRFVINPATDGGRISLAAGVEVDHENPQDDDGDGRYHVLVTADNGSDTETTAVTINIIDDSTEKPAAPSAPSLAGLDQALRISWTPSTNNGPPIFLYYVSYRTSDIGNGPGAWSNPAQAAVGNAALLTGLKNQTLYEVKVQALNNEGTGDWSLTSNGKPREDLTVSFDLESYIAHEGTTDGTQTATISVKLNPSAERTLPVDSARSSIRRQRKRPGRRGNVGPRLSDAATRPPDHDYYPERPE